MSKLTDSYRTVGVFNPHNFANGTVFITYDSIRGRGHNFQGWKVHKAGLDLGTHWTDHNSRCFDTFPHEGPFAFRKVAALAAAKAWASERFGVKEWARTPYGSYGPADFVAARIDELNAALTEAAQ